ncbi:ras-related protein Rab-36-like [Oscarella lobularis]|uniref:ras-related protein Rab-36-like n=1 Tax=Oscarella lobularis TaxID=121494 RepID=UPI003313F04B
MSQREQTIDRFPLSFRSDVSIKAEQTNFHPKVRAACAAKEAAWKRSMKACKAIVVGDVSVGKTSLVNKYCRNAFEPNSGKASIGMDFDVEKYRILGQPFTLQLWDTAGQERFKSIAKAYYKEARIIVVVFDLTRSESLQNSSYWLREALSGNVDADCDVYIVGTKKDLCSVGSYERREASAVALSEEMGAEYWPTSSLTGENVESFFTRVAVLGFEKSVLKALEKSEQSKSSSNDLIRITKKSSKRRKLKKSDCCK